MPRSHEFSPCEGMDHGAAVPEPLPPAEEQPEDPHGKRPRELPEEGAGQSSNPRRRSREDMEGQASQHLKTCCTPYPATVSDLYHLEQEAEETLRHYIWRFRGVVDRIIPKYLCEASVIAAFHVNVRNLKMREKMSIHVVDTLESLWDMANRCARMEEAANLLRARIVEAILVMYPEEPCCHKMYPEVSSCRSEMSMMNKR